MGHERHTTPQPCHSKYGRLQPKLKFQQRILSTPSPFIVVSGFHLPLALGLGGESTAKCRLTGETVQCPACGPATCRIAPKSPQPSICECVLYLRNVYISMCIFSGCDGNLFWIRFGWDRLIDFQRNFFLFCISLLLLDLSVTFHLIIF